MISLNSLFNINAISWLFLFLPRRLITVLTVFGLLMKASGCSKISIWYIYFNIKYATNILAQGDVCKSFQTSVCSKKNALGGDTNSTLHSFSSTDQRSLQNDRLTRYLWRTIILGGVCYKQYHALINFDGYISRLPQSPRKMYDRIH